MEGRQLPPPIHYLTGLLFEHAESGAATFSLPMTDWLLSPQGVIAGSTLALLVDGPLGCAVQTALPAATPYTTAEISLTFVRRVPGPPARLRSTCQLVHMGKTVGIAEGRVVDDDGTLVATCATRCVVLPRLQAPEGPAEDRPRADLALEQRWTSPHPFERPRAGALFDAETLGTISGLEALQRCIHGAMPPPPISHLCGIVPTEVEPGRTVWTMPASEWLCSPVRGRLYGGAIAYLAGTAIDGTAQSVASTPLSFAPVDLKVYFLRPVRPDGRDLTAIGTLIHRGGSVVVGTSEIHDADGKQVAVAVGSALLRRRPTTAALSPLARDGSA